MSISRRSALKALLAGASATAATTLGGHAEGAVPLAAPTDAVGLLYDTTLCIGCKACVVACADANDRVRDTAWSDGLWMAPLDLNGNTKNIIKLYDDGAGERSFVKQQCMHCIDPACANACMLGALKKREFGIVSYDPTLCVGCRYCQMACPFNVPKFEWADAYSPQIVKCELCRHRLAEGREPACTEVCPRQAVIYGKRADLLKEAHRRLETYPERYVPRVYGETEAGGTQVLYLSHVPFDKIGLPDYDSTSVPSTQRTIQHGIYQGFVAPLALYGALATVMLKNRKANPHDSTEGAQ
jgi:Fe-S-cluster-containing dehydrogenase component